MACKIRGFWGYIKDLILTGSVHLSYFEDEIYSRSSSPLAKVLQSTFSGHNMKTALKAVFILCPGEDSNLHLFRDQFLKLARLPLRHLGRYECMVTD